MEQTTETTMKKQNKSNPRTAFALGIGVFILIVLLGGYLYIRNGVHQLSESNTIVTSARMLRIPVAEINGTKVLYADYVKDMQTLRNFYISEGVTPPPTDEEISNQVLARLLANVLISDIAKELDVTLTEEDITEAREAMLSQFPDEATLVSEIEQRYGWTSLEEYIDEVVRPALLEQKVMETYTANHTDEDAIRTNAQAVLDRILSGEAFEPLAAEFGSDGTRFQGGDLGYFTRGVMVPEFETAVFAIEPGTVAPELVETQFGYHIVKVEDKRTTTTPSGDEVEEVRARHILFQTAGDGSAFIDYMDTVFQEADIEVFLDIENPFEDLQAEGIVPDDEQAETSSEDMQ